MGAKRALIVDDSRSARLFLARMLEKYEIDVDSAESAESAIEYLASHRPDVIFMDHLMPGMDGFQAVQAIKNNPRTATIPIMMYTSQEGELYLGQARALGAVGVLPKQIKPADVSKVLYQLHLVVDRRTAEQTTFRPVSVAVREPALEGSSGAHAHRALTESALREQFAELRRALVAGVDTQTDRITAEVRALLLQSAQPPAPEPPTRPVSQRSWAWTVAGVAILIALVSWAQRWAEVGSLRAVRAELAGVRAELARRALPAVPGKGVAAVSGAERSAGEQPRVASGAVAAAAGSPPAGAASRKSALPTEDKPLIVTVPYGADALGGSRLEIIRQFLDRLNRQGVSGVVDIRTFAGRFCLAGNSTDGYSLAPDETPANRCDVVGNPPDEALSSAQRTPLAFANLVGTVRSASHGALDVQVTTGDPAVTATAYPQVSTELTAGEWNRAAAANNRIEIRLH